ncbi:ATP-dependent DNA helicase RecG [Thiohalobacter thiocyanaticus]|uniref:ATP-dependent DNA helicase RecG n=1 Tax=Thiohalobacter thiocyanaticus TaxID=585455 RepID=A0A426QK74_9GAMM|nr:ATP-dependent DNA helicase RecG [Thiohalobacter thiocyanaticus]RRQ22097.1 ATP-dependent DNA helicase RecG [Thiohalobacter thiocyanaticus]
MDARTQTDETLDRVPVTALKGVGPRLAEKLARLNIATVQDALFHLPLRYEDRTRVVPIGALQPGGRAVIEGEIGHTEIKFARRRMLLVHLADGTGALVLRFFHFNAAQQAALARGSRIRCFGEVRSGPTRLEMVHPEYRRVDVDEPVPEAETLTPIYPATEGVHQLGLRSLTDQALAWLEAHPDSLPDWLADSGIEPDGLPGLRAAIQLVHRPPPDVDLAALEAGEHPAQRRLVLEELVAHHLSLRVLRWRAQSQQAPVLRGDGRLRRALREQLAFPLTGAQERVVAEIEADVARAHPMLRLVQGDVGSGKTVVAALAALAAVESGMQVALMAPTELLAEQHLRNFADWLTPLGVELAWLSGRTKGAARRTLLEQIRSGAARVVIGTHALFQEEVEFHRLGLVIIDEQHRFGVHQRLALRDKGGQEARLPHQLTLTATPIPRTLAMAVYADLDTSVIDELPPGRKPVTTVVIPDSRRPEVVERVRRACAEGRQAYWVCTLIEESESLQCQAAEEAAAELREALPELRVGLVHGRLKSNEKAAIMAQFKQGGLDLLVATTVIEVGVDVPNASLMVIENAERLGLAQLHQLRGRVGRGAADSHCVLLYHTPLSSQGRARLGVMRATGDGFEIARKDLELRGPGEVLGTRQTGMVGLRIADLMRDEALLPEVNRLAERLNRASPQIVPLLIRRWLGENVRYGSV